MKEIRSHQTFLSKETELRKDSHLELALQSKNSNIDDRFYYEPMLAPHPNLKENWEIHLGHQTLQYPLWISSMTGGTTKTNTINLRLAHAAKKFGLGMGVGSARIALEDSELAKGFELRPILGENVPFYLNFGIAQIEKMIHEESLYQIKNLLLKLNADGIIIHVNPLQEWMQPEGDFIQSAPIGTIEKFMQEIHCRLIVKEVGQGFGLQSMRKLLQLPLTALEFAANGGTNFSKLELMRNKIKSEYLMPFIAVGHSAEEMVTFANQLKIELGEKIKCQTLIISGGIKNYLDGYYLLQKSNFNAIYGQASGFLEQAKKSQEALDNFVQHQIEGLLLARQFLTLKEK